MNGRYPPDDFKALFSREGFVCRKLDDGLGGVEWVRSDPVFGDVTWVPDRGCASFLLWYCPSLRRFYDFAVDGADNAWGRLCRMQYRIMQDGGVRIRKSESDWLWDHDWIDQGDDTFLKGETRIEFSEGAWHFTPPPEEEDRSGRYTVERYRPTYEVSEYATLHDVVVVLSWASLL